LFEAVEGFYVEDNLLTGIFPFSISNLTELQVFDISWNAFKGPIPLTLGRLNKRAVSY